MTKLPKLFGGSPSSIQNGSRSVRPRRPNRALKPALDVDPCCEAHAIEGLCVQCTIILSKRPPKEASRPPALPTRGRPLLDPHKRSLGLDDLFKGRSLIKRILLATVVAAPFGLRRRSIFEMVYEGIDGEGHSEWVASASAHTAKTLREGLGHSETLSNFRRRLLRPAYAASAEPTIYRVPQRRCLEHSLTSTTGPKILPSYARTICQNRRA